jgi:hypothetical protein
MIIFFTEEVVISKKGEKLEITDLKPGQDVVIVDHKQAFPIRVISVYADQHISAKSLASGTYFVYTHPEDIIRIESMEGKTIHPTTVYVKKCPKDKIAVPITDCASCNLFIGKTSTMNNCHTKIICEDPEADLDSTKQE